MKNHIVFKFLAMILCAAFLLGAVGSGAGIILMTEMDLYNRTVDEAYEEQLESYALSYAMHVSEIYASQDLGNAGNSLVHSYYDDPWLGGVFYSNRIGYTIQDILYGKVFRSGFRYCICSLGCLAFEIFPGSTIPLLYLVNKFSINIMTFAYKVLGTGHIQIYRHRTRSIGIIYFCSRTAVLRNDDYIIRIRILT